MTGRAKLEILFIFLFAVLSNKWMGWEEGIHYVRADDSASYLKMAYAAPQLPTSPPNFHHGQRIFVHYLLGVTAKFTGIELGTLYQVSAVALSLLVALLAQSLLLELGTIDPLRRLLLAAFLLSPYVFRYYWIAPTMLADLLFVVGLALMFRGLIRSRLWLVLAGCVVALLGRQNIILVLPGIGVWMAIAPGWRKSPLGTRAMMFGGLSAVVLALFIYSGKLVSSFALPMENGASTFISFFVWLLSPNFSRRLLAEHLLRVFLPGFLLGGLILAFLATRPKDFWSRVPLEFFASLVIAAALFSQPLVVNPMDLGGNQSRQAAIGLLALVIAAAYLFRLAPTQLRVTSLAITLLRIGVILTSFHHMYTVIGPSNVLRFTAVHIFGCVLAAAAFFQVLRSSASALEGK